MSTSESGNLACNSNISEISNIAVFDIEIFKNYLLISFFIEGKYYDFEYFSEKEDWEKTESVKDLKLFLQKISILIGFNNRHYDNEVLCEFLRTKNIRKVKEFSDNLIEKNSHNPFSHALSDTITCFFGLDIDLMSLMNLKISLKILECGLNMKTVRESRISFDAILKESDLLEIRDYCHYDIRATFELSLRKEISDQLEVRKFLSKFATTSDLEKIISYGMTTCISSILPAEAKKTCGFKGSYRDLNVKTAFAFSDIIDEKISYKSEYLQDFLNELKNVSVDVSKRISFSRKLKCFDEILRFGLGGLHSENSPGSFSANEEYSIIDVDVASFYPALILKYQVAPLFWKDSFLSIYEDYRDKRLEFKREKNSPGATSLKLMLNGTFGKFKSKESVFYNPKGLYTVTLNGELSLLMLIDSVFSEILDIKLVQANTDGCTFYVRKSEVERLKSICRKWESSTGFELEYTEFSRFIMRDVNNYLAEKLDKKIKSKGIFNLPVLFSSGRMTANVITLAVNEYLLKKTDISEFIKNHFSEKSVHDFFMFGKRSGLEFAGKPLSEKVFRVYYSKEGSLLTFETKKSRTKIKDNVSLAIDIDFDEIEKNIDLERYIEESQKILSTLKINLEENFEPRKIAESPLPEKCPEPDKIDQFKSKRSYKSILNQISHSDVLRAFDIELYNGRGDCPSGHGSSSGSCFKYYQDSNSSYCFSCQKWFRNIDIVKLFIPDETEAYIWLAQNFDYDFLLEKIKQDIEEEEIVLDFVESSVVEELKKDVRYLILSDAVGQGKTYGTSVYISENPRTKFTCVFPTKEHCQKFEKLLISHGVRDIKSQYRTSLSSDDEGEETTKNIESGAHVILTVFDYFFQKGMSTGERLRSGETTQGEYLISKKLTENRVVIFDEAHIFMKKMLLDIPLVSAYHGQETKHLIGKCPKSLGKEKRDTECNCIFSSKYQSSSSGNIGFFEPVRAMQHSEISFETLEKKYYEKITETLSILPISQYSDIEKYVTYQRLTDYLVKSFEHFHNPMLIQTSRETACPIYACGIRLSAINLFPVSVLKTARRIIFLSATFQNSYLREIKKGFSKRGIDFIEERLKRDKSEKFPATLFKTTKKISARNLLMICKSLIEKKIKAVVVLASKSDCRAFAGLMKSSMVEDFAIYDESIFFDPINFRESKLPDSLIWITYAGSALCTGMNIIDRNVMIVCTKLFLPQSKVIFSVNGLSKEKIKKNLLQGVKDTLTQVTGRLLRGDIRNLTYLLYEVPQEVLNFSIDSSIAVSTSYEESFFSSKPQKIVSSIVKNIERAIMGEEIETYEIEAKELAEKASRDLSKAQRNESVTEREQAKEIRKEEKRLAKIKELVEKIKENFKQGKSKREITQILNLKRYPEIDLNNLS